MDGATPAVVAFKETIDSKLLAPVQRNLFTGEPEAVEIEVDHPIRKIVPRAYSESSFDQGTGPERIKSRDNLDEVQYSGLVARVLI